MNAITASPSLDLPKKSGLTKENKQKPPNMHKIMKTRPSSLPSFNQRSFSSSF